MTQEQIDKEKAVKVEKATAIQPDIKRPEVNSTELSKSQPVDTAPPKESAKQYSKKVGDYNRVVEIAKEKGVDLNNIGEMPLMDSDKGKITDAVKSAYGRELATGIQGISDAITAPQNEERNKLDVKALMNLEKQKRRSKWADALYAFGEGLQGKTANPNAFVSTKIQRKQDEQFQQFKDVTERNKKTKFLWEDKSRKEMIDWADQEAKNMQQSEEYRQKMKMLADKYTQDQVKFAQDQKNKDRGYRIQEDRNNISRDKKGKDEKTVKVQTAQKTYELKPEEAAFYKGEILKKADTLRKKYPGWFTESRSSKQNPLTGEIETGPVTYKLNPEVSETDMIRAYLEEREPGKLNEEAYEQNKAANFDKYRKQKGLSTGPASQDAQSKPKQTVKADPLGLGL